MSQQHQEKGKWLPLILATTIFLIGTASGLGLHGQRVEREQRRLALENEEAARQYAFLAQRQLDAYASTGLSLAAHLGTSTVISNATVNAYVKSARHFEQLKGIRAYGYLPRLAPELADDLERRVQADMPGYRIRGKRPHAEFYYPVLYLADPDPARVAIVRGLDYSIFPERLTAIRKALATGGPVATPVHASVHDFAKIPVVVTFTPVRTADRRFDRGTGAGVVFSVMRVAELFEGIDNGKLTRAFVLAVHERDGAANRLVYTSDRDAIRRADADPTHVVHATTLRFTDRTWHMRILSKPTARSADAFGDWPLLTATLLASLIAAFGAYRLALRQRDRRIRSEMAQRFEVLLDSHPFAVYAADRTGAFVFVNRKMQQELGLSQEQLLGMSSTLFMSPSSRAVAETAFQKALHGEALAYHASVHNGRGAEVDLAVVLVPVMAGGQVDRVLGFAENVTERKRVERELHASREMLRLILDTIPDRVFWKDRESRFIGANRHMVEAAGLPSAERIVGLTDADMPWMGAAANYQDEDRAILASGCSLLNMQRPQTTEDGEVRWFDVSKLPLTDDAGTVAGVLGIVRDITRHKQMEEELTRRANHDSLTGLPNRAFFHSQLSQAIARAQRRRTGMALMYFDIDRFKQINDTHGHDVGDQVIRLFADRVCANLRASDFVARLGGDEFVLIVEDMAEPDVARRLADKLLASMEEPLAIDGQALRISTSIGIAVFDDTMTAGQLIKAADDAMYDAKRAGRNCFRVLAR